MFHTVQVLVIFWGRSTYNFETFISQTFMLCFPLLKIVSVYVLDTQSCPTLWNFMDCSPPRSSDNGILQARILEWITISFSRASSQPRDRTRVSCIAGRFFTVWATREALNIVYLHFLYGKKQTFNVTFLHKPQGPENTFQKKNLFEFYTRKKNGLWEYFQLLICNVIKKKL